jgi:quercetin dioxygenase-like cupin family protein
MTISKHTFPASRLQIKSYLSANPEDYLSMFGSEASGLPLVKSGPFGADMLKFCSGQKTGIHTHEGDHILFVVEGQGWLLYGEDTIPLITGTCYFVPGNVRHQVGAEADGMFLMSVGNFHQSVDSRSRLQLCP